MANYKNWAQEMLKMSSTTEGKKEVINTCLIVLKHLSENSGALSDTEIQKIAGSHCPWHLTKSTI